MKWLTQLLRGLGSSRPAGDGVEEAFRRFVGDPRGLRLNIVNVETSPPEMDSFSVGHATLRLQPAVLLDSPESLLSLVKARLYCMVPQAVAGVPGVALGRQGDVAMICWEGREFAEPAWYLRRNQCVCGPIGFRYGEWNDQTGCFELCLMCVIMKGRVQPGESAKQSDMIRQVGMNFRDTVRCIEI